MNTESRRKIFAQCSLLLYIAAAAGIFWWLTRPAAEVTFTPGGDGDYMDCRLLYTTADDTDFRRENSIIQNRHKLNSAISFPIPDSKIDSLCFVWERRQGLPVEISGFTIRTGSLAYKMSGRELLELIGSDSGNTGISLNSSGNLVLTSTGSGSYILLNNRGWEKYSCGKIPVSLSWTDISRILVWELLLFAVWYFLLVRTVKNPAKALPEAVSGRNSRVFVLSGLMITAFSLVLFTTYFGRNIIDDFFDAMVYHHNARVLYLWKSPDSFIMPEYRTYLYPLLIAVSGWLAGLAEMKTLFVILQYLLLAGTAGYIIRSFIQQKEQQNIHPAGILLTFGAVICNPYLVQASTLLLTDVMAACFVALAFHAFIFFPYSRERAVFAAAMIAASGMIRPAMFYFVPAFAVVYTIKFLQESAGKTLYGFLKPAPMVILCTLLICLPQFLWVRNVTADRFMFPIAVNLGTMQNNGGMQNLKYGTFYNPSRTEPVAYYKNVFYDGKFENAGEFYREKPFHALLTHACHILSVIDQGCIDTYSRDFNPLSRKVASFFYYLYWYVLLAGLVLLPVCRSSFGSVVRAVSGNKYLLLGIPALCYLLCISGTQVESRFIYPVLLLTPYLFYGGGKCAGGIFAGKTFARIPYRDTGGRRPAF